MKYLCLVYHDETTLDIPDEELEARLRACGTWVGDLTRGGRHIYSAALQAAETATTLRSRNGRVSLTDGPFAETKEVLAGFTLIEAPDLNEALREASKLAACCAATIEVRALLGPGVEVSTARDRKIASAITKVSA
jgi:hypothetical protein